MRTGFHVVALSRTRFKRVEEKHVFFFYVRHHCCDLISTLHPPVAFA